MLSLTTVKDLFGIFRDKMDRADLGPYLSVR